MDNASNCNTLAALLPNYIETFHGPERHLRCIAHILNLVAKVSETLNMMLSRVNLIVWIFFQVFLSFFFKKQSKCKLPAVAVADNTDIVIAPSTDDSGTPQARAALNPSRVVFLWTRLSNSCLRVELS